MSTNKPRIQAYIQSDLYQQFEQERSQWGVSQSQALERMLLERYQFDNTVNFRQPKQEYDLTWIKVSLGNIRERLTRLEIANNLDDDIAIKLDSEMPSDLPILSNLKSVSELDSSLLSDSGLVASELNSELNGSLLGELDDNLPSELELVASELDSDLELVTSESVTSELDSSLPSELIKGISQRALARRLKCSHTLIGKLEKAGEIGSYTKQHDPAGLEWEFRAGKYYPATEVSSDRQSAIK